MFWDGVNLVYSPNPPKIKETRLQSKKEKPTFICENQIFQTKIVSYKNYQNNVLF